MMTKGGSAQVCKADRRSAAILLVEDEVLIRISAADDLREAGWQVIEAGCEAEAKAILASGQKIDLVASDIMMGGVPEGLSLAAEVRRNHPGIPVMLISASLPDNAMDHADRVLTKPYLGSELVSAVREMLDSPWTLPKTSRTC